MTEFHKAERSYNCQQQRCENPKNKSYRWYGAKGIQVKYKRDEFKKWWVSEQNKLNLKRPTISRISHDGHYEFGNVKLEEYYQNCIIDRIARNGGVNAKSRKPVHAILNGEIIHTFESVTQAALRTGVVLTRIASMCRTASGKTRSGLSFRYA